MQQKELSNQKIEENKSGLEFNFPLKSNCASLNFEIWVFGANLTKPYLAMFFGKVLSFVRSYVVGNDVKGHSIWLGFRGNDGVELSEKLTEGCR